jgi:hypothetical protein
VKASFIATKGTMGKFIGMVEKIQKEDKKFHLGFVRDSNK